MALAAPAALAPIRHTTQPLSALLPLLYGNLFLALVANRWQWSHPDALNGPGFMVVHKMGSLLQLLWLYHPRSALSSHIFTWSRVDAPANQLNATHYLRTIS